jgi:hypothetical protein
MLISRHVLRQKRLPPYLLAAAIDYINHTRPKPSCVGETLTTFALRLGYDATTAVVLAARVRATARMFAGPHWPSVRRLVKSADSAEATLFDIVVQRFIATEPLDANLAFDTQRLLAALLSVLPHKGRA